MRHETVLEVLAYRPEVPELVVLSGFGRSQWLRNIEAGTACEVVVGRRRFAAAWRRLGEAEAAGALRAYERRHWWMAPIVRAVLSRLVGWRYDGSEVAARRLVDRLPVVAFRPIGCVNATAPPPSPATDR